MHNSTTEPALRCTIVVPAYNAARYIEATLHSVLAQSVSAWELLVVDDGSTDDTCARVLSLEDGRLRLASQTNQGPSAARNHGLRLASAPCVLFLDSDDVLCPGALARLLAPLEADAALVAAYGEVSTIDESGAPAGTGRRPVFNRRPSGDVVLPLLQRNFIVSGGALCMRREAALAAGAFREDLHVAEDLEFWCRLALQGPVQYVPAPPVLAYRIREGSVVRSRGKDPANALRSVAAIFENPVLRQRLGAQVPALRHKAEAAIYSFTANECLRAAEWSAARALLWESLRRDPRQAREAILFVLACVRWLPRPIRRHLK